MIPLSSFLVTSICGRDLAATSLATQTATSLGIWTATSANHGLNLTATSLASSKSAPEFSFYDFPLCFGPPLFPGQALVIANFCFYYFFLCSRFGYFRWSLSFSSLFPFWPVSLTFPCVSFSLFPFSLVRPRRSRLHIQ